MIAEFADLRARLPVFQHREAREMFAHDARRTLQRLAESRGMPAFKRESLSQMLRESLGNPDSERRAAELDVLTSQARRMMR